MLASSRGHIDILKLLLDNKADIEFTNLNGDSALIIAASKGQAASVSYLLMRGANVNAANNNGENGLILSVSNGHVDVVKVLLSSPAIDVNHQDLDGITALNEALSMGSSTGSMVKLLKAAGAK